MARFYASSAGWSMSYLWQVRRSTDFPEGLLVDRNP